QSTVPRLPPSVLSLLMSNPRLARTSLSTFFFNSTATTHLYTLSLHDALPICRCADRRAPARRSRRSRSFRSECIGNATPAGRSRSEEHTSELQSLRHLVCRLLLEKKKEKKWRIGSTRQTATSRNTVRSTTR